MLFRSSSVFGDFKQIGDKTSHIAWHVSRVIYETVIHPSRLDHASECCVLPEAKYLNVTANRISAPNGSRRRVVCFSITGPTDSKRLSNDSGDRCQYLEQG